MDKIFTKETRVKLYYKILDLLPPPSNTWFGDGESGEGLVKLDEYLRKHLGKLELAPGHDVQTIIQNYILSAPENELLTVIEFVPGTYAIEKQSSYGAHYMPSYYGDKTEREFQQICSSFNEFLESIGSPARFQSDGIFIREAFAVQVPEALLNLPTRDVLQMDLQRLLLEQYPVSAVFSDLDNFKAVNAALLHAGGDRCLEKAAITIGSAIAKKGKLYRYGGDEFVVVLPNFRVSEALPTAERIRADVENANPGETIAVTLSIGVASSEHPDLQTAEALLNASDAAANASKNSGKNCVTIWIPGMRAAITDK